MVVPKLVVYVSWSVMRFNLDFYIERWFVRREEGGIRVRPFVVLDEVINR